MRFTIRWFCTDLNASPLQIVLWFIQRWQLEVTHREVREHLGVETQPSGQTQPLRAPRPRSSVCML